MEELKEMLKELRPLMSKFDEASEKRREEIFAWLETHKTPESQNLIDQWVSEGLDEQEQEIKVLRDQIEGKYRLIPMSYIADKYFGKSRQWLYQRINGAKVRGRVYTLNEEQKDIFNRALQDIAQEIGSLRLA